MHRFIKFLLNNPVLIFSLGGVLVFLGEMIGATDDKPDNTISEKYEDLPDVAKDTVILFIGALLAHLVRWMAPVKTSTNVIATPGSHVEVNEAK